MHASTRCLREGGAGQSLSSDALVQHKACDAEMTQSAIGGNTGCLVQSTCDIVIDSKRYLMWVGELCQMPMGLFVLRVSIC